jgi:hypothetical protein
MRDERAEVCDHTTLNLPADHVVAGRLVAALREQRGWRLGFVALWGNRGRRPRCCRRGRNTGLGRRDLWRLALAVGRDSLLLRDCPGCGLRRGSRARCGRGRIAVPACGLALCSHRPCGGLGQRGLGQDGWLGT